MKVNTRNLYTYMLRIGSNTACSLPSGCSTSFLGKSLGLRLDISEVHFQSRISGMVLLV